jgi:hypothetical protein
MTAEVQWCGVWWDCMNVDCPTGGGVRSTSKAPGYSVLWPSLELSAMYREEDQ